MNYGSKFWNKSSSLNQGENEEVADELIPDTLLDRSPRIVIELNVCKNSEVP